MTTLDSLLVRIDASTELLRRELAKGSTAVNNFSNNTERSLGGFGSTLKKMGTQIRSTLGLFGIGFAVTAVTSFTRNAIQAADAIGETAAAAGLGAERFQRLAFVFRQNGVSAQEFEAAMRTANTRLGQFITSGAGPAAKAIEQLGLKQRILNGEIRTNEQFVDAIIAALGKMENGAQRAALASAFFGREAGAKLQETLGKGTDAINEMAEAATGVLSDDTVAKASATADAMERLGSATWNWVKALTVAATYEVGKTFGVEEIAKLEETAERRVATLRDRERTLRAFGNQQLSPAEARELAGLEAQIAARGRFRTGGRFGVGIDDPAAPDDGLSEIRTGDFKLPGDFKRFDFRGANAAVLNSELQEVGVVIAKMPDDLKKLSPEFNKAVEALERYNEGLTEAQQQQKELLDTVGHGLHSAIANALRTGRLEFKQFLKDLAIDLASSAFTKGLMSILGGAFAGAGGGIGGFFGRLFGGKRGRGGPMERGKGYLINEGDPELFFPGMSGSMVRVAATAGKTTTHNHFAVDARGAMDPAAVEAAVHRGVLSAVSIADARSDAKMRAAMRPSIA